MKLFDVRQRRLNVLKKLTPPEFKVLEKHVVKACLDFLRMKRYYPIRLQSGRFWTFDRRVVTVGEPGIPDYIVIHAERPAFFMETKRPKGPLSPEQENKHWELTDAFGLTVMVADSYEALSQWLVGYELLHRREIPKAEDWMTA